MQLPADLRAALDAELENIPPRDIIQAGTALSERYRASHGRSTAVLLRSQLDALSYATYRLPATYAAVRAIFAELQERRPDLRPASLLDLGGGPGTAAWAAANTWPDLGRMTIVERDPWMVQLGEALARQAWSPALRGATWQQSDITAPRADGVADLTVTSYVLGELSESTRTDIVQHLWERTTDTCVIVEPGTPRGYTLVREAAEQLVHAGSHVLAPFPLEWNCLEHNEDWCHFSERVPRTRLLRDVKGGTLSYEDEKYSYVAVSRHQGLPIAARIIRHPQTRSGHIRLVLCTAGGVEHIVVARSNREAYRRARKLVWGSAIPIEDAALYGLDGDSTSRPTM